MKIHIFDTQKSLKILKPAIRKIVKTVIEHENQLCAEVTVHFVDNAAMCQLHDDFFNDPSPTDCMSFPMDGESEPERILGEIFVCPDTAIEYGKTHDIPAERELTLYIIHGLLHLMGYDDIRVKDRALMRKAERRHVARVDELGIALHVNNLLET